MAIHILSLFRFSLSAYIDHAGDAMQRSGSTFEVCDVERMYRGALRLKASNIIIVHSVNSNPIIYMRTTCELDSTFATSTDGVFNMLGPNLSSRHNANGRPPLIPFCSVALPTPRP